MALIYVCHGFIFVQSLRDTFYFYPTNPHEKDGVFAVRYKQYKAHFLTQGWVLHSRHSMLFSTVASCGRCAVLTVPLACVVHNFAVRILWKCIHVMIYVHTYYSMWFWCSNILAAIVAECQQLVKANDPTNRCCMAMHAHCAFAYKPYWSPHVDFISLVSHTVLNCVRMCTLIMTAVPAMERLWKTLHCCLISTWTPARCTRSHQMIQSTTRPWASFQR